MGKHVAPEILAWDDPPPRQRQQSAYRDLGEQLKENPGVWALIKESASNGTGTHAKKMLGEGFETTTRKVGKDRVNVYARYVG